MFPVFLQKEILICSFLKDGMNELCTLYIQRADNELVLAEIILKVSDDVSLQQSVFEVRPDTWYSAVIGHSYYSIFYATKSYLLTKGVKTVSPDEHKKTYEEFRMLVDSGIVDYELLKIYIDVLTKADALLRIFRVEKEKRTQYTYKKLPQSNRNSALESLEHARKFLNHISDLLKV